MEEPDIEKPRVEYLYADLYLDLDNRNPGVNIDMPPEATNPVKTIGVAENEEDTDPQGTYKENQPSSKIGGDGE